MLRLGLCRNLARPFAMPAVRRPSVLPRLYSLAATTTGPIDSAQQNETDLNTGEIAKGAHEFVLYYNGTSIPSGQISKFIPVWMLHQGSDRVVDSIKKSLPSGLVEVTESITRDNEGGLFVKYKLIDPNVTTKEAASKVIESTSGQSTLFGLLKRQAYFVRGTPWIEDLQRTFTSQVRVTFDGPDVSPEELYHEMRCYGRIVDIEPPSPASKDIPRSAVVTYKRFTSAATARNCINRLKIKETRLHLSFIQVNTENPVTKWIASHPRISVPILIALFAALAYLIFEPLRFLSISYKAKGYLDLDNYSWLKWISSTYKSAHNYVYSKLNSCGEDLSDPRDGQVVSWGQIYEVKNDICDSLKEGSSTFNVLLGPKGSGKDRVIALVLESQQQVPTIQIDCQELGRAKTERAFLESLAHQLGYWPAFLWVNGISRFVDLAATSLSGQNSGLSETADQQANRMLNSATSAIQSMALRKKRVEESDQDYLARTPEARPIVVLRNYRGGDEKPIIRDIASWAGALVNSNAARVIVVTQDASYDKSLSEAMPNRVLKVNAMTDASVDVAKSYVTQMLKSNIDSLHRAAKEVSEDQGEETSEKRGEIAAEVRRLETALQDIQSSSPRVLEPLGGRLSDLQNYMRRLLVGEPACDALETMVQSTSVEIEQMFLNYTSQYWSSEQVWVLMSKLSALDNPKSWLSVPVEISTDALFSGSDGLSALRQLEYRELLVLNASGGEIHGVRAGKPLYHAAFRELIKNPVTWHIMEQKVLKARIKLETAKITQFEQELSTLAAMPAGWAKSRQTWLSNKLDQSQQKVETWEKKAGDLQLALKKIL